MLAFSGATRSERIASVWHSNFLWSAPSYFISAGAAAVAAGLGNHVAYWLAPFALAPIYLTYRSYTVYLGRIEDELEKVKRTRELHRQSRKRVPYPIVALVGYTNAGKSTLFNRLTRASVLSADMLFATLDPTLRALSLPHGGKAMLSDTVGFISNLPTQLVAAFRATLEEVLEADVILHVRDISH